jgi:hypothetical protein
VIRKNARLLRVVTVGLTLFTVLGSTSGFADGGATCVNKCGDGTCQEIVCFGLGCPCPETAASCPQDCGGPTDDSNT